MNKIIHIVVGILLIGACSTTKYVYLNEDDLEVADSAFYPTQAQDYKVQPGDILYVSVHSSLSETEGMFHFPGQEMISNSSGQGGQMYLNQSVVNEDGDIRMPVIGMIYVAGSGISEIEEVVEKEARKYVSDAMVRVKLASYEISFLGEFNQVGKVTFYKDRVHILEAISQAGEITYFGDRSNVRVLRKSREGIYSYRIDLTDKGLLTSNKFYLQPNDIIYAEPLPRRIFRVSMADYTMLLATITSTIGFIALIVSLNK